MLDVALTHPSDTGRRFATQLEELQARLTSVIHISPNSPSPFPPQTFFSFQAPLLLWNAALLGSKHAGMHFVSVWFNPLLPKDLIYIFIYF